MSAGDEPPPKPARKPAHRAPARATGLPTTPKVPPPRWDTARLAKDIGAAKEFFRKARLEEPLESYLEHFEDAQGVVRDLLEETVDLGQFNEKAQKILADKKLLRAIRYLSGPPVSTDDLKVVAEVESLAPSRITADVAKRIAQTMLAVLDRERFPWVGENREATEEERERAAMASAVLLAAAKVQTERRGGMSKFQEQQVRQVLKESEFTEVRRRPVTTVREAPNPGEFCMESKLGSRKADLIVGLPDTRIMPIECKVSNSETNSIKRINNDAAVKAEFWRRDFGDLGVVPVAVLSGVYKLSTLQEAQNRGLTLFWAHDLGELAKWIGSTKQG